VANAFAVLLTNKGAPLLYYGDEIGLPGAGDPDNRRFMKWSAPSADETYLKDRIKKLSDIRAAHPALRRGRRATLGSPSADLWVYSQTTTGDTVYVAINRGDTDQSTTSLPAGPLAELVTGATVTGSNATIPPRQTRIFVPK
jgi:glycosidase